MNKIEGWQAGISRVSIVAILKSLVIIQSTFNNIPEKLISILGWKEYDFSSLSVSVHYWSASWKKSILHILHA